MISFVTVNFMVCKTSSFEERHNEGTEITVNAETIVVPRSDSESRCGDIVLITIREVDRRLNELSVHQSERITHGARETGQNGIAVSGTRWGQVMIWRRK